jgi:hypothetical protein
VNTGDLGGSEPPSAGFFKPELVGLHRQILQLIQSTGSRFMVNVYPFLVAEQAVSAAGQSPGGGAPCSHEGAYSGVFAYKFTLRVGVDCDLAYF